MVWVGRDLKSHQKCHQCHPSKCPDKAHVEQMCWPPLRGQMQIIWTHLQTTAWVFDPSESKNDWQKKMEWGQNITRGQAIFTPGLLLIFNEGEHSVMCSEANMNVFKFWFRNHENLKIKLVVLLDLKEEAIICKKTYHDTLTLHPPPNPDSYKH